MLHAVLLAFQVMLHFGHITILGWAISDLLLHLPRDYARTGYFAAAPSAWMRGQCLSSPGHASSLPTLASLSQIPAQVGRVVGRRWEESRGSFIIGPLGVYSSRAISCQLFMLLMFCTEFCCIVSVELTSQIL